MQEENISLYYKQERSDKIYKASLAKQNGMYLVNFAYGRRGATLKTGTKTQVPIDYDKAKKIYDKLVLSKMAKGYQPNEDDSDYVYTSDQVKTGIHCQLLNPIEEDELIQCVENEQWWAQEKMDGKRMLIQKKDEIIAINRKGLLVGAPRSIMDSASAIDRTFIIDGEAIGDDLHVFDLLALDGNNLKGEPYHIRYALLLELNFSGAIQIVKTSKTTVEKQLLYTELQKATAEGIVYKKHDASYQAGRPNSGGDQVKFKFYETASVLVSKVNDKRSVGMTVNNKNGQTIFIGNVTIAVNKEIPTVNSVIEVRYLYAYKGGSLYQPTFLNIRTDIDEQDCSIAQLKYKKEV